MKRRIMIVLTVVLIFTLISATAVFAKTRVEQDNYGTIGSMFGAMRNWIDQAQENGEITEKEAREWGRHFDDMQRFHEDNGFGGHCGGFYNNGGNTNTRNYMPGNMRRGMGGMMRGFSGGGL